MQRVERRSISSSPYSARNNRVCQIVLLFANCFSTGVDKGIAQGLAYGLESTINALHPFHTDVKGTV